MNDPTAGSVLSYSAAPVDTNLQPATLPSGVIPVWAVSDNNNASVVASADGLSATVTVAPSAPIGTSVTVTASLPDGTAPTGSASFTTVTLEVASFIVTRTA